MTKQAAHTVGEIGTAVAIALITKRPSTFALEVSSSEAFTGATSTIDKLEQTLTELDKCHEVDGLSTDEQHTVVKDDLALKGKILEDYDAMHPGPLGDSSEDIAASFSGGKYQLVELREDTVMYRVWSPGQAKEFGAFWTLDKPLGILQAKIDYALRPEWGEVEDSVHRRQATNFVKIKIPKGTKIYIGKVANQGGSWVGGAKQAIVEGGAKREWKTGEGELK